MAASTTIQKSRDWTVRGKKLTDYRRRTAHAVLPDGIEAIGENILDNWSRVRLMRSRVVFPDSLKRLTWDELIALGDVQADLPEGFLRRDGGDTPQAASRPLGDDWRSEQVTLASAARAYLLKPEPEAALAESVIQPEDAAQAAKLMAGLLRARTQQKTHKKIPPSVLLRAVVFFIQHVEEIAPETVMELVRLLPNGRRESMRMPVPVLEGVPAYHPALLDYVLHAAKIEPNHAAFRGHVTLSEGRAIRLSAVDVKSAVVPYIAAGLDVAIQDNASEWLPWTKYQRAADAYSVHVHEIENVVAAIVPGLQEGKIGSRTFSCAVLVGRFGPPWAKEDLSEHLVGMDPASKYAKQILTGFALTSSGLPRVNELDNWTQYALIYRHMQAQIDSPVTRLMLRVLEFEGDERQATHTIEITDKKSWEVVAGPEMQIRWRPSGERKLRSWKELPAAYEEATMDAARLVQTLNAYMQTLKSHVAKMLEALYMSGAFAPAAMIRHMAEDLTLVQAVCGVVWEQDGGTFTLTGSGPVDAEGETVTLSDSRVYMAYAPKMDPEEVEAWKKYFQGKPYDSWMGQMEEPDYSQQTITEDRIAGISIKDSDLRRKKMLEVIYARQGSIYAPTDNLGLSFYRRTGGISDATLNVTEVNRTENRILFQLDMATMDERIRRDDPSILPFLERAPLAVLRKARKTALDSDAAQVKAAILTMLDEHDDKHAKDRFSLALRSPSRH